MTVDAVVVGAGPGRVRGGAGAGPGGPVVVLLERGAVPRREERLRRRGLRPDPRRGACRAGGSEVPVQRWVTRRSTMVMTPTQALTVDYRTRPGASPPYNGMTTYRADFDSWLAGKAVAAGATAGHLDGGHGPAARRRRAGRRGAHRPARRRHPRPGRDRLRRRELVPGQGGRAAAAHQPGAPTLGVKEVLGAAARGDRRAVRPARRRGPGHRDARLHQRHPRRRLPLHQPRHGQRRRRASASTAWPRPRSRPEELIADAQGAPGDRAVPAGRAS